MASAPVTYALTVPMVKRTAATAATAGPAVPTARPSRAANGTDVAEAGPSTPIVTTARPRYSAEVVASAIAITRGSCLAGLANRVVSGATASQPMNDSISVVAARPTDGHPCGANGVQFAVVTDEADPATATVTSVISKPTKTSWTPVLARSPIAARTRTASSSSAAATDVASRPPPIRSVT